MPVKLRRSQSGNERGQVVVIFALMIPVFLALGGFVIGIGNWYVHGKHLQTKADAGAFAGGGDWAFPCGPQIDARIAATARLYAGSNNPQVGGVPNANVHTVLNGPDWYDDDSNPVLPSIEFNSPPNFSSPPVVPVCNAMILDVKVTEDNSFPLFSLIPLFPDIKRRARVEIQEVESATGLLPIAVRAPVSINAAVFYNETTGDILDVKYFVRGSIFGLPSGLQGWSTYNTEDANTWASFSPPASTGVAIAISFRRACNTNLPNPNTNIPIQATGPCFEDEFGTVSQLCNQGTTQLVNCYYATGSHPTEAVQSGLHFIRGYQDANPGTGPPALESAYLENVSCNSNGYFNWQRTSTGTDCQARLDLKVDVGSLTGTYPNPPGPPVVAPLRAQDIQVRFRLVRGNSSAQCNYGNNCDLTSSGSGPTLTYSTQGTGPSPHLLLQSDSQQNAVAIEVRLKNVTNSSDPDCGNSGFSASCRWFYTGDPGPFGTSVAPTDPQILAKPIQRSFRGNTLNSSSVQWLRLSADTDCDGVPENIDLEAASQPTGVINGSPNRCFLMDMGLKGGLALDVDEQPFIFNDGVATSKTGILDCDPAVPPGQAPIESVEKGCGPWYAPHSFDTSIYGSTLCPDPNDIFDSPNPGGLWGDWPPLTCVKTRSTSTANQLSTGFENRFFGGGSSCPPDATGFVMGRNYWDASSNPLNNGLYGYKDDSPARDTFFHPADPRVVTIFLVPTYAIITNGSVKTYPITGFVQVYVTGFGRINGSGNLTNDDPCPGNTPPPASEYDCNGSDCGEVAWGHFINHVGPSANNTPSGVICNPGNSLQPCVATLVE